MFYPHFFSIILVVWGRVLNWVFGRGLRPVEWAFWVFLGLRLFNTCNRISLGIKMCLLFSFSIKKANQSLLVVVIFPLFTEE